MVGITNVHGSDSWKAFNVDILEVLPTRTSQPENKDKDKFGSVKRSVLPVEGFGGVDSMGDCCSGRCLCWCQTGARLPRS